MTEQEEEEAPTTSSSGKPNAYWQRVREEQEEAEAAGFGGNFRAIPSPHGGPQYVHAKDVTGSYDECWCGLPADHDWVGKDQGRKHPPKVSTMTTAVDVPHIDRRQLRAFNDNLVEVILKAVNEFGLRYRLTKNGCLLYPKDGSRPYTIHARTGDGQVARARRWLVTHVDQEALEGVRPIDMDDAARLLAEQLNSEEHLPEAPAGEAEPAPVAPQSPPVDQEPTPEPEAAESPDIHVRESEGWEPYRRVKDHTVVPGFLRKGDLIGCMLCDWTSTEPHAMGGHMLRHDKTKQEGLWGEKSQDKKRATIHNRMVNQRVSEAIGLLHKAIGTDSTPEQMSRIKELEKYQATLIEERDALVRERDTLRTEVGDLRARLDLMREALRA